MKLKAFIIFLFSTLTAWSQSANVAILRSCNLDDDGHWDIFISIFNSYAPPQCEQMKALSSNEVGSKIQCELNENSQVLFDLSSKGVKIIINDIRKNNNFLSAKILRLTPASKIITEKSFIQTPFTGSSLTKKDYTMFITKVKDYLCNISTENFWKGINSRQDSIERLLKHQQYLDTSKVHILIQLYLKDFKSNKDKISELLKYLSDSDEFRIKIGQAAANLKRDEDIENTYKEACELKEQKKWKEALAKFEELGNYKDSPEKKVVCKLELIGINSLTKEEQGIWWNKIITSEWRDVLKNTSCKENPDCIIKSKTITLKGDEGLNNLEGLRYLSNLVAVRLCWSRLSNLSAITEKKITLSLPDSKIKQLDPIKGNLTLEINEPQNCKQ